MTTLPIVNHSLTQRRLQFIGTGDNNLALKSIGIINNYNIVSSFICWNQNKVHMKVLDTSFKMKKRTFREMRLEMEEREKEEQREIKHEKLDI